MTPLPMCSDDFLTEDAKADLRRGLYWRRAVVGIWWFSSVLSVVALYELSPWVPDDPWASVVVGVCWPLFIVGDLLWCIRTINLDSHVLPRAVKALGVKVLFWTVSALAVGITSLVYLWEGAGPGTEASAFCGLTIILVGLWRQKMLRVFGQ